MRGIYRNSLAFKTILTYIIVTLLNITVFIVMVFENQMDLISENTVMNSEKKGVNFKSKIESILTGKSTILKSDLNRILKEAKFLGIRNISIFEENGNILTEAVNGKITKRKKGTNEEIKWINKAITRSSFEDKIFTHNIIRKGKSIRLYIPIYYTADKTIIISPYIHMADIDKLMNDLYKQCLIIGAFLILIHIGMGVSFSRMILKPLSRINEATAKISQGNLQARVEVIRNDELGQLAISFNEMTIALARMHDEAKGANPLTGLPGNLCIHNEIEKRLKKSLRFAVLYCDLDNFKAYNDKYGFSKGDEIILHARSSAIEAARKLEKEKSNIFIGHEGGDDFVVVSNIDVWEKFTKLLIANFDRGVPQYYNETDAKNRYIESVNRQGVPMRFPLVSISVAVVSNEVRKFTKYAEIVSVAAEMKKYVKSKQGSCYAIDRRKDPPKKGYTIKPLSSNVPPPKGPFPPGVKPNPIFKKQNRKS